MAQNVSHMSTHTSAHTQWPRLCIKLYKSSHSSHSASLKMSSLWRPGDTCQWQAICLTRKAMGSIPSTPHKKYIFCFLNHVVLRKGKIYIIKFHIKIERYLINI